jgi:segregation and condensation protein A|tara:strand:+ start:68258 stop:68986 length:729 start_codon:yes stop_codon:yes gene_type:complete
MTDFQVKTPAFEGPLDLLLTLIEKRKLFINDISLASVTDDYVAHMNSAPKFSIARTADFVLIAATLLLIKSKSLLPQLNLSEEEEDSIEDLEIRLKLYKRMRSLGVEIKNRFGKTILFSRESTRHHSPVFSPDKNLAIASIKKGIDETLSHLPKQELAQKTVVKKVMNLEEVIDELAGRIAEGLRVSFKEFSKLDKGKRTEVIVSFLAMLELVKRDIISVTQEKSFSDIVMETDSVKTPKYS